MKNIREIIELLTSNGIVLFVENNRLSIKKRKENQLSDEILLIIKSNKEELITFLKSQKNNSTHSVKTASDYGLPISITNKELNDFLDAPKNKDKITNISLLTPLQKGFLFHNLYENNSSAYVCQFYYDVKGELSKDFFKKSWEFLMQKHTVLRTAVFGEDLEVPVQCVFDQVSLPLTEIDYSNLSPEKSESAFDAFLEADKKTGFCLEEAPLFRITLIKLGKNLTRLVFTNHHIMLDGWSIQVLMNSFRDCYQRLESGLPLPVLKLDDYKFHVQSISSKNTEEGLSYWKKYLKELKSPSYLPFIKDVTNRNKVFGNKTKEFTIFENIQDFTKKHRITENTFVQGVWAFLLSKYTKNRTVVFGATISGRNSEKEGIEGNVGLYINAIPVCNTVDENKTVDTWLQDLQEEQSIGREEYGYLELSDIEAQSTVKKSLFDTFITFINYPEEAPSKEVKEKLVLENFKAIEGTNYTVSLVTISSPGKLDVLLRYNDTIISEQEVFTIKGHLEELIKSILSGKEYIKDLNYLREEEKNQLLNTFNDTKKEYPKNQSIIDIFSKEVALHPERIALVHNNEELTYEELDKRSNQVAHYLLSEGVIPGNIVGLLFDRSVEMIIGMFGVLKTGAGYLPLDSNLPEKRIRYMLNESRSTFLLSKQEYLESYLAYLPVQNIDSPKIMSQSFSSVTLKTFTTDLAYCIFTSGSTGNPKGVIMSQSSVVNLVKGLRERVYEPYGDSVLRVSLLASYAFDASVQQIFGALLQGHSLYIIEDETRKDGDKLLSFYNDNKIDVSDGTPTHLRFLVDSLSEGSALNSLSSWILAGEVLPKDLVCTFYSKLGDETQLYNFYGPTETCVDSTSYKIDSKQLESLKNIPIGKPLPNERAYVTDSNGNLVPVGVVGELCIAGDGLAQRYIGDPSLTSEKFSSEWIEGQDRVYRTGDMVRWLPDGNLEYHGRMDDQVKIRGYRIELAEIEEQLNTHPKIEHAIVVSKELEKETNLVVYYKGVNKLDVSEIREYLLTLLPEYMVPFYYMHMDDFTYMNNGKIDRKSLPDLEVSKANDYEEASNEIEDKLIELYSEILMLDPDVIGVKSSFIELGGHSLKMVFLANSITKQFGVKISLKEIMENPTISELGNLISSSSIVDYTQIPASKPRDYYPLSSSQKRMYYMYEYDKESVAYNIPMVFNLEGVLDKDRLETAFRKLIQRHESLRTVFGFMENDLVQRVLPEAEFSICHLEIEKDLDTTVQNFIKPFDLSQSPLLRVGLIRISEENHTIIIDCHHIVSDEVTNTIMLKDFASLYRGESLKKLRIQYKDYVVWQQEDQQQQEITKHKEYWLNKFSNKIPALELPYDYPRSKKLSNQGGSCILELNNTQTEQLKKIARSEGVTMYTMFLALYNILLYKLTSQNDIVIGTPVAGRQHIDLEAIVGVFINTLPIKNILKGEMTFKEFVQQVQKGNSSDLDHQLYPYEELVDSLKIERDASRNPLFDVFFTFQKQDLSTLDTTEFTVDLQSVNHKVSKFDLTLVVAENENDIHIRLEYADKLFKHKTAERFMAYFEKIISAISANTKATIADIDILDEKERKLLSSFSPAKSIFHENSTIVDMFERQVCLTPLSKAAVYNSRFYNYETLNEKANQLARYLQKTHAISKGEIVGVLLPKSDAALISILAILKLGAAYLPIDTNYPVERTNYIIENSGLRVLITKEGDFNMVSAKHLIDYDLIDFNKEEKENLNISILPNDLAYIIYTSGSTGHPKGVMIEHGSNVNMSTDQVKLFDISSSDTILWFASIAFDASVSEIMMALYSGATLVIPDDEIIKDTDRFCEFLYESKTSLVTLPPSYLEMLPTELLRSLRGIITAGESANATQAFEVIKQGVRYFNAYGPTECAVCVSAYEVTAEDEFQINIPIGRPIANTEMVILDNDFKPVPIGIKGTIYVAGKGLARGYLNNPDLTNQSFITMPGDSFKRFYNTGDLGEWTPNGLMLFHGRKDNQIKLRGYRIELGEIEGVLSSIKYIRNCHVVAREGRGNSMELVGYVILDGDLDKSAIQKDISRVLPDHMIPRLWVELDKFPLTINGKIDTKALLQYNVNDEEEYVAPINDIQKTLVEIWSKVLKIEENKVSITADFFSLGGNSLTAIQITTAISKSFSFQLELNEIFRLKTIDKLSHLIELDTWIGNSHEEVSMYTETII